MARERASINIWDRPTYVYRAYDANGRLLYVGISENVESRLRSGHRKSSTWYPDARLIRIALYADRRQAIAVESWVILHESPTHNYEPGKRYLPDSNDLPAPLETHNRVLEPKRKYND